MNKNDFLPGDIVRIEGSRLANHGKTGVVTDIYHRSGFIEVDIDISSTLRLYEPSELVLIERQAPVDPSAPVGTVWQDDYCIWIKTNDGIFFVNTLNGRTDPVTYNESYLNAQKTRLNNKLDDRR